MTRRAAYHFVYDVFCDWYVEIRPKPNLPER